MEPNNNNEQEKKKLNDDVVVFMHKRSEHDAPRYTARLRTYVDVQRKRRRAAAARRHSEQGYQHEKRDSALALRKKLDVDPKDKVDNSEHPGSEERMSRHATTAAPIFGISWSRRGGGEEKIRGRSISRSRSGEPSDRCGRRRRRRRRRSCRRRRRRRRSRRRRRRRRSCRRRRRRRRSCSRRRRRRSCRRRRRRRRRRRC